MLTWRDCNLINVSRGYRRYMNVEYSLKRRNLTRNSVKGLPLGAVKSEVRIG